MPEDDLVALSIRVPKLLDQRIAYLSYKNEERTGFRLSKTAIIRTLLEEALNTRGIPRDINKLKSYDEVSK